MSIRTSPIANFSNLLLDIATQQEFNLQETLKKYCLDSRTGTVLRETGLVQTTRKGWYKWVGPEPTDSTARDLRYKVSARRKQDHENLYHRKTQEALRNQQAVEVQVQQDQEQESLIDTVAAAAELAVRLGKSDIRGFIRKVLNN